MAPHPHALTCSTDTTRGRPERLGLGEPCPLVPSLCGPTLSPPPVPPLPQCPRAPNHVSLSPCIPACLLPHQPCGWPRGATTPPGRPPLHPHGLRPGPDSRGSYRAGHTHLAPPQPDHRPDMTCRQAAASGGTGSGRLTLSMGQTQPCSPPSLPSKPQPALPQAKAQSRTGLLRPHDHQSRPEQDPGFLSSPAPLG